MLKAILVILTLLIGGGPALASSTVPPATGTEATTEAKLQLALRDLWTGHIFWVRSVVLASHYQDVAGVAAAEAEAIENARAIADAMASALAKQFPEEVAS